MTIRILNETVIAQIAAGEVVERPASVAKELIENAIDAGARTIQVAATEGGRRLLRVSDDGHGIPSAEVELAFARHATSKLETAADLERIRTLGFRGEALSSIAAVSRVTLVTRHTGEGNGSRYQIEGGEPTHRQIIGAPVGTIITVENLFFNTPARLKFLKTEATEKRHITGVVTNYAMAYPHIRFVLEHDGREVFRSSGSGQLADVIVRTLGLDTFRQMIEIGLAHNEMQVRGYTTLPELHRADRSHITLFVNGRAVQDTRITYAVVQAYHGLLASGKYPISVLLIDVPTEQVDVNVHPTKAEVRFSDPNAVFSVVQRAVREALIAPGARQASATQSPGGGHWHDDAEQQLEIGFRLDSAGMTRTPADRPRVVTDPDDADDLSAIPVGIGAPLKPRTLPVLRVVGQVGAVYIVAEGPAGMYLVDQNAAHQRVLYQQLRDQMERHGALEQRAVTPQTLDLPPRKASQLEGLLERWLAYGLVVEPFGKGAYLVRGVPAVVAGVPAPELIMGLLDALTDPRPTASDPILRYLAGRAAVKSGQVLSAEEQMSLIRQLERCPDPLISPDGRTTLIHMSGEQIAREFRKG